MRRAVILFALLLSLPMALLLAPMSVLGAASGSRDGVTVANWSALPIRELFLSPGSAQDWGRDRLEGRAIAVGDDVRLLYGGACNVDLRVVFDNTAAEERHDIDICSAPFIGVRPGWTTSNDIAGESPPGLIRIRNRSGRPVTSLFLFAAASDTEGADRLGHDVLPDGVDTNVLRPRAPTCDFSMRAVFEGGEVEERRNSVDLCRYGGLVIEPPVAAAPR